MGEDKMQGTAVEENEAWRRYPEPESGLLHRRAAVAKTDPEEPQGNTDGHAEVETVGRSAGVMVKNIDPFDEGECKHHGGEEADPTHSR
jgi:hypothetical protein